jgi:hypothetical protein
MLKYLWPICKLMPFCALIGWLYGGGLSFYAFTLIMAVAIAFLWFVEGLETINTVWKLWNNKKGQGMVDYLLLAIVITGLLLMFGAQIRQAFNEF